ncbi:amidohydrolase [Patescibacteria group bacterium]|nr:amidohydrolase [Patescibacteria group bacterium]
MSSPEQPGFETEITVSSHELEPEVLETIHETAREFEPRMIEVRRQIHENPELGFQEHETAKLVVEQLKEMGIAEEDIETEIGGTGVVARIRGLKEGGPVVALRADMDALPVEEDSGVEFASKKEGVMHACGHDAHTASLVGSAKILTALRERGRLDGDVLLLFQPNEERATIERAGSVQIIKHLEENGLWSQIEAIHAVHVHPTLPLDTIRLREGLQMAGSSRFHWKIKGPGGHGMDVHSQPNPNLMATEAIHELHRKYNPQEPQDEPNEIVFNPTDLESEEPHGRFNVTGKHVDVRGTLRVLSDEQPTEKRRGFISAARDAVDRAIEPWREAGAEAELHFIPGTPPVVHRHPEQVRNAEQAAQDVIGEGLQIDRSTLPGGEDFAFYLRKFRGHEIPGSFVMLGASNPEAGIPVTRHHAKDFLIDERVIKQGAELLAEMALLSIKQIALRDQKIN